MENEMDQNEVDNLGQRIAMQAATPAAPTPPAPSVEWMEPNIMQLVDEYAHCYAFVGDDTMPIARARVAEQLATLQAKLESAKNEISGWCERWEREYADKLQLQVKLDEAEIELSVRSYWCVRWEQENAAKLELQAKLEQIEKDKEELVESFKEWAEQADMNEFGDFGVMMRESIAKYD